MTMKQIQLLIVDDDDEIRDLLSKFLEKHQFSVDTAAGGEQMDILLARQRYDLIILDIMMPGEDGLSICRRLRTTVPIPIIMLTAAGDDTDRIVGLEMGADDYLPKPFNPRELLARIKAVLRRTTAVPAGQDCANGSQYAFDTWYLDTQKRELCHHEGDKVELTTGEYNLLLVFLENPQQVLNRDQLLDLTKGREASPFDRSVDVQLSRLRKKIEPDPKNPSLIKTVRGGGYIFTSPVGQR